MYFSTEINVHIFKCSARHCGRKYSSSQLHTYKEQRKSIGNQAPRNYPIFMVRVCSQLGFAPCDSGWSCPITNDLKVFYSTFPYTSIFSKIPTSDNIVMFSLSSQEDSSSLSKLPESMTSYNISERQKISRHITLVPELDMYAFVSTLNYNFVNRYRDNT